MITVIGHADLTPDSMPGVEAELRRRLERLDPSEPAVVRAGAGPALAFGRAAKATGHPLVVFLPSPRSRSAPLPEAEPTRELLELARQVRLQYAVRDDRAGRISADEHLVAMCRHVLAVWDGSPTTGQDATAHLVGYALSHSVGVEVVWPADARRSRPEPPGGDENGAHRRSAARQDAHRPRRVAEGRQP